MSRAFSLIGTVIKGQGRGKALGFPTANLALDHPAERPPAGVYACCAKIPPEPSTYQAIMHIGPRPTFPGSIATVEVHLIAFPHRKLYGKKIQVGQLTYLRPVRKFSSPRKLTQAIRQDARRARNILNCSTSHDQTTR